MSTIVRLTCPACEQVIETLKTEAEAGMKCPTCGTGFVPHQYKKVTPAPAIPILITAPPSTTPVTDVRRSAKTTHVFALLFMLLGAATLVIGFFASVQADKPDHSFVPWGLSFLGLAFLLELLAQIIYIRAAVEESAGK